jgi:Major Facilitator Superfamily
MDQPIRTTSTSEKLLFWASFFTLVAAGIGFTVRAAIVDEWGALYGFTQSELGKITGGGLIGFGLAIIVLGAIADKIGYGRLMALAFFLHASSAVVTLSAGWVYAQYGKESCYMCLMVGGWLFSLGNGTCEAVINPMTATMFPHNKTHYLNILHAGWPAGLISGALIKLGFDKFAPETAWQIKLGVFLVPVVLYGLMMVGRKFPVSETSASGVSFGTMLSQFAHPVLLFLILIHGMVGYVELGTDSWISSITGKMLKDPSYGLMLFLWTSFVMFTLRFFAGPIVHKISPLGLLFASAVIAALGLYFLGSIDAAGGSALILAVVAATIYGLGKTFFWPTMLGVISERFPKGGALTLAASGGFGMLCAGMLGGPLIGFKQDFYASNHLKETSPSAADRYLVPEPKPFTIEFFNLPLWSPDFIPKVAGVDNAKAGVLADDAKKLDADLAILAKSKEAGKGELKGEAALEENLNGLKTWWDKEGKPHSPEDKPQVEGAKLFGGQQALIITAVVPAAMAVCYLLLILFFSMTGGYKQKHIEQPN